MAIGSRDVITVWTNDPVRASWAGLHGVDRVGVDLETIGKQARQRGLETWISPHRIEDLEAIHPFIGNASLFVRCNALGPRSRDEVDRLLDLGVEVLMLPNFSGAAVVERFLRIVDGRAQVVPLVERATALASLDFLASLGIEELHVGLNDLSIDLGLSNRLVALAGDEIARFSEQAAGLGLQFGIGGLGRAFDDALPVPSDLVYAQHARLGSRGALLARSFFCDGMNEEGFAEAIRALRERLEFWRLQPPCVLEQARLRLLEYAKVLT